MEAFRSVWVHVYMIVSICECSGTAITLEWCGAAAQWCPTVSKTSRTGGYFGTSHRMQDQHSEVSKCMCIWLYLYLSVLGLLEHWNGVELPLNDVLQKPRHALHCVLPVTHYSVCWHLCQAPGQSPKHNNLLAHIYYLFYTPRNSNQ